MFEEEEAAHGDICVKSLTPTRTLTSSTLGDLLPVHVGSTIPAAFVSRHAITPLLRRT